jgi:hypothetical protein
MNPYFVSVGDPPDFFSDQGPTLAVNFLDDLIYNSRKQNWDVEDLIKNGRRVWIKRCNKRMKQKRAYTGRKRK